MEFNRIFTNRKVLILTLLLLVATTGIYIYTQVHGRLQRDSWEFLSERQQQSEYVSSYGEYLSGIIDDSNNLSAISIFQKTDSYASRNLQKTKADFEKIQGVEVEYGQYDALTTVIDFELVHYVIYAFVFLLVWFLFEDEKKGLWCISYAAPRGRKTLALRRIGVLAAGSALFVTGIYFLLFLAGYTLYGGTQDWENSIQSVMMFASYTIRTTVIGYIFLYIILHILITFAISLLTWMILLLFRNHLFSTVLLIIILGIEGILSFTLKDQSPVVFLKYENIFRLLNPGDVFYQYRNYNLFGQPVNCFRALLAETVVVICVSAAGCVYIAMQRKPIAGASGIEIAFERVVKQLKRYYHRGIEKLPVFGMELYKILITQKGFIFLVLWVYLQIYLMDTNSVFYMGDGNLMQEIYSEYSGPDDGRLREYVARNEEVLKQSDEDYEEAVRAYEAGVIDEEAMMNADMRYGTYDALRNCISSVSDQLSYVERIAEQKGIDVWFLYDKGYRIIMTGDGLYKGAGYGRQEERALLAVLLLVFFLCTEFSYDRSCGMERLLKTARYGRRQLFRTKIRVAVFLCLFICAVTYGLEIYEVNSVYPLTGYQAPVQSLMFMEDFPFTISIGMFLTVVEAIHFVTLCSIAMMIYAFSSLFRVGQGMIASLAVLTVPAALKMLGVTWCAFFSVTQPLVYVEALQEYGFAYSSVIVVVEWFIGIGCYLFVKKKWCDPHEGVRE